MQNSNIANLHLVYRDYEKGYAIKLLPPPEIVDKLKECQEKIRNKLEKVLEDEYGIKPKFRVQGSFAYGTCNSPARPDKGQELDLDYGAYLPASVFRLNTNDEPNSSYEAKKYIQVVYDALTELAKDNLSWTVDQKPSCIRISGITKMAHMDVPLYAVPNNMFDSIKNQNQLALDSIYKSLHERFEGMNLSMESYDSALNEKMVENEPSIDLDLIEMIHMAKEDGSWFPSDCEKVRAWFKKKCSEHPNDGRQLRYIARYLKGWRDQQWAEKGPTSIVLMIATVNSYKYFKGRDDLALLEVTSNLDTILANNIYVSDMEDHEDEDFNRANDTQRIENATKARQLYSNLSQAQRNGKVSPSDSIQYLRNSFGCRIPNDTSLITCDNSYPIENILETPSTSRNSSVKLTSQSSG